MTLDPFGDETARVMEPTQRQLEHHAGACRSSALVLTLEGLPDQAAPYLAAQRTSKSSSGNSAGRRRLLSHQAAQADCLTGMVPASTSWDPTHDRRCQGSRALANRMLCIRAACR
jgi:hypothetical protein